MDVGVEIIAYVEPGLARHSTRFYRQYLPPSCTVFGVGWTWGSGGRGEIREGRKDLPVDIPERTGPLSLRDGYEVLNSWTPSSAG